jgi:hypothetical protein
MAGYFCDSSAIVKRYIGETGTNRFLRDFNNLFGVIKIDDAIIRGAIHLAQTHVLRGYDAIQLSSALSLKYNLLKLGLPSFKQVSKSLATFWFSFRVHASACFRQRSAAERQTKVWTLNQAKYLITFAHLLNLLPFG